MRNFLTLQAQTATEQAFKARSLRKLSTERLSIQFLQFGRVLRQSGLATLTAVSIAPVIAIESASAIEPNLASIPAQTQKSAPELAPQLAQTPGLSSVTAKPVREPSYPDVRQPDPKRIPPNPLEDNTNDPLYPDRTATLDEEGQRKLRSQLDQFSKEAQALMAQKKSEEAFVIWRRELRLRRFLGVKEEIFALARVGEIAWRSDRTRDLRDITERLQLIQGQIASGSDAVEKISLNEYLALAYQVVRSPQHALSIYDDRLQRLRELQSDLGKDPATAFQTLNSIGLIHLDWFRYEKAQQTYSDLRDLAKLTGDRTAEALYLIQLTYIAEQRRAYKDAIVSLEALRQLYSNQPEVQPALHLRLAENYDADRNDAAAEIHYKKVFTLSQALATGSYSSTAMFQLGALYRRTERLPNAAQVYEYLVEAETAIGNRYGAMQAADLLGQVHMGLKNYGAAIAAYEQALTLAQKLAYQPESLKKRLELARQALQKSS